MVIMPEKDKLLKENVGDGPGSRSSSKGSSSPKVLDIPLLVQQAREAYNDGVTRDLEFRKRNLRGLLKFYNENRQQLVDVLHKDLRKHAFEAMITEVNYLINDVKTMLNNLDEWSKPKAVQKSLATMLDRPYVLPEPHGVVLVMGAWNYPLQLSLVPVSGAIAAGNCVVIKPSDLSPATSAFIADTLPRYVDSRCFPVVCGGIPESTQLLEQQFDYIFYTGSSAVGKIVREASNKHLTPVTLELGGKSPVWLDETVNMDYAVRRILWGKVINLGQTCIAPDYLLCTKATEARFLAMAKQVLKEWFGDKPEEAVELGRIVNQRHFERVKKLLESSGKVALGGRSNAKDLFIEPTVLTDVKPDDSVMQEEIFGPVLPIVNVQSAAEAIHFINSRERPLAAYIFTSDADTHQRMLSETSSGGIVFNETLMHYGVEELPFGGVGMSGMGAYHGKFSFDTFTHYKPVLERGFNPLVEKLCSVRYPPYTPQKMERAKNLLKNPKLPSLTPLKYLFTFGVGVASVFALKAAAKRFGFDDDLPYVLQ
ncbi:aldehyde dehydrogenase family 3 member B1-like isoform X2 [Amphibalanus amphitrite]|uniref:aldehyde dehydrogenase family 3 member B1-like isoform X2 n=1 Tax=Amphibalanus amphitrite TaxID=1232801 RepID=UPI001C90318F|nr:aldehyde dehydrogenase family 3 member B1-like isoform X2 [Amphibalanus amphitrite]XP_043241334.1 aldehyde dehydrogenase family 3 member B1-like isoform X2 [Amphibalanus amphitrite]XP_043241335.1 aldehyde dehydrogenase family 3 member B1-like isoform X2 [Amphibalanus amphitrite]